MTPSHVTDDSLRTKLIQTGLRLIATEGYNNLSLRKVAKLCEVSHNAPYKHFANKEELVQAIMQESAKEFQAALAPILTHYHDDPKKQIIELGVAYVTFMVANPDYLQFSFMNQSPIPICIESGMFHPCSNPSFNAFRSTALRYLETVGADLALYDTYVLSMWSLVHGLASLFASGSITSVEPAEVVARHTITTSLNTMFDSN